MPGFVTANTTQGSSFFVNLLTITNGTDTFDSTGAAATLTGLPNSFTIGGLVVRDLGKTVRVPAQSDGPNTTANQRILRKVQRVDANAATGQQDFPVTNGFTGFNEGVGGGADSGSGNLPSGFHTFYIDLGATATRGAVNTGGVVKWARLSMPTL